MAIYFFDVDGTLADNMDLHYETFNIIFSPYNLKMPINLWQNEYIGEPGFQIIKQFLKKEKIRCTNSDIISLKHLRNQIYDKMVDQKIVKPFSGLLEFLKKSKKRGNIHIITSNSIYENVERFLKVNDLYEYFDDFCTPENYKPKPSFDMFEKMLKKYSSHSKNDSILFEDSILGARTGIDFGLKTYVIKKTYKDILKIIFEKEIEDRKIKIINNYNDFSVRRLVRE